MFEYKPGMSLVDPWLFTTTRAQAGYFIDSTGKLVQAAVNTLRDRHYPFGLGSAIRTTLFEPAVTNFLLRSQELATAPWTSVAATVAADVGVAPDGTTTADRTIPDVTNVNNHRTRQQITVTANEFLAGSIFLRAEGYHGARLKLSDTTGGHQSFVAVDLDAKTITASGVTDGSVVLTGSKIIPLANGWMRVEMWGTVGNADTTPFLILQTYDTAAHATADTAFAGDGTSGILAWGAQFERAGVSAPRSPSSYIATTSATVSRGDEGCSTPWPFQTMPAWCYTAWYDLGGSIWLQSAPVVTITGVAANTDPTWCPMFLRNNGQPGTSYASGVGAPGLLGSNRNTLAANGSLGNVQPYDFVETFSWVRKDGATFFDARRNGGTIFQAGPLSSAVVPFVDILNPLLCLGRPFALTGPQVGVTVIKIGGDPTKITTLVQAAAA